jgi:lipopolysaccharide export system protein LptA
MIQNAKQALLLACVLVALLALCWYHAAQPLLYKLDPKTLLTMPDHQITTLEVRQFNAHGQLVHHMTTPYMHHIPQHNQHWAKTPHVNTQSPNKPNWAIQALEATAYLSQNIQHGVYRGQVTLDHGDTHVRAFSATTQSDTNNQLTLATALGKGLRQAHVWITRTRDQPALHAFADQIRYEPNKKRIVLSGHARLQQGEETFAAPTIVYDLTKKQVVTQRQAQQRTEITIHSSIQRVMPHE